MNGGLHPARGGFHPFQLLFLNEQTPLSSSKLQPHPVQSHGYVSMATVSDWVHMGKQREQKERAKERERDRETVVGGGGGGAWRRRKKVVSPWKSKPGQGFDWHHMGRPAD